MNMLQIFLIILILILIYKICFCQNELYKIEDDMVPNIDILVKWQPIETAEKPLRNLTDDQKQNIVYSVKLSAFAKNDNFEKELYNQTLETSKPLQTELTFPQVPIYDTETKFVVKISAKITGYNDTFVEKGNNEKPFIFKENELGLEFHLSMIPNDLIEVKNQTLVIQEESE